ncbi:MAG: hypothetical protein JST30_00095 [Armatimonadetes bacterium]|nr:hypothetical protein [Armatimonadota bacterium]
MRNRTRTSLLSLMAVFSASAFAAPFTPGNIVISRVGDGSAALSGAATAVFLDEYTPGGLLVQSVAMPTALNGNNRILTNSGSAGSEGFISLSVDGKGIAVVGYDAPVGTATVATTSAATFNRVVGWVKADGTVDTTTNIDGYDGSNVRSACTIDGSAFWTGGTAGSGLQATAGVRYNPYGPGQLGVQLSTDVSNTRNTKIQFDQLFVSTMSGAFRGVNTIGTGVPTTSGQTTVLLPGFDPNTSSTQSVYDFWFADSSTLYVADDRSAASGGGLQKWTFDGTTWTLAYTLTSGIPGNGGIRGLTAKADANGNVLYATSTETNANSLVAVTDTGAGSTFSVVAVAGVNTRFRGLAFSPAAGGATTETLAPVNGAVSIGKSSSGGFGDTAVVDNVSWRVCKFVVTSATSPIVRVRFDYTTTKTAPTAIDWSVTAKMVHSGTFKVQLLLSHDPNNPNNNAGYDVVLPQTAINTTMATYTGSATSTPLSQYVGTAGTMSGRVEVYRSFSAVAAPCVDIDAALLKVTG